ncbi:MAG: proteasome accessory factor PafA2 family protein [Actinomycetaceae bacterium]|nr:proteasome accessory factor PafA2 family protein [Actinomycetaceae bacterium]
MTPGEGTGFSARASQATGEGQFSTRGARLVAEANAALVEHTARKLRAEDSSGATADRGEPNSGEERVVEGVARRRVMGLETEFGLLSAWSDGRPIAGSPPISNAEAGALMLRHRPKGYRNENLFMPNGGRAYLDIGSHPEYATAECATLRSLVAQDRAGEEILLGMAQRASVTLQEGGTAAQIHLLKNNVDSAGNTYGCHENYMVTAGFVEGPVMDTMAAFLATRPVLVGAGDIRWADEAGQPCALFSPQTAQGQDTVAQDSASEPGDSCVQARQWTWIVSPRAAFIRAVTSKDTTEQRALVNTRNEAHADATRWGRLHVTYGDTNISEWATAIKVGLTVLILEMCEAGAQPSELILKDPIVALNALGNDPNGAGLCELVDGRKLSATQVQREFLDAIAEFLDKNGPSPTLDGLEVDLLRLAHKTLDALEACAKAGALALSGGAARSFAQAALEAESLISDIAPYSDWALKRQLVAGFLRRQGREDEARDSLLGLSIPVTSAQDIAALARLLLAYHDLATPGGLVPVLRGTGAVASLCAPEEILAATHKAPKDTRAKIRGAFLEAVLQRGADYVADWTTLRLDSPPTTPVDLLDPLATENEAAAALTAKVWSLQESELTWINIEGKDGLGVPG